MENHVDYKNIMEYEIDESEEEDYNFNNKISDDEWWQQQEEGDHYGSDDDVNKIEQEIMRQNQRPLTSSSLTKLWTPDAINEEIEIKNAQVQFSPIVVRNSAKFKGNRWWKPSKIKKFFKKYETDRPLFNSRVRWAGTKLGEVIVATRHEKLPSRIRTIVSSDLLLVLKKDLDDLLPQAKRLVQDILSAIFPNVDPSGNVDENRIDIKCNICLDNGGPYVCNHCKKRFCFNCFMTLKECLQCLQPITSEGDHIRLALKNHQYSTGTSQLLDRFRINNFLSFQSWFEFNDSILKSLRFEMGFDPAKREFERRMAEERRKNIAVLNRSTKRWQMSIIGVVFRRWRDVLLKMKNAQEKMVKMMYRLKGVSARDVFKAWRTFYRRDQINPVKKKTLTMEERIIEIQAQLKHVSGRVRQIEQRKSMTVGIITSLTIDVNKATDTLKEPNRQRK